MKTQKRVFDELTSKIKNKCPTEQVTALSKALSHSGVCFSAFGIEPVYEEVNLIHIKRHIFMNRSQLVLVAS